MIRLKIREIALAKGFNQSSLSRAVDVHFMTIKRVFQNPYKEVTTTLDKVSQALGVSICDLLEQLPDPPTKWPELVSETIGADLRMVELMVPGDQFCSCSLQNAREMSENDPQGP